MPTILSVKFRYAAHDLWFDPRDSGAVKADHVICQTVRGLEIGVATDDVREVSYRQVKAACGDVPLRPVERVATGADLARAEELARRGEDAFPAFRRLVEASGLDMKPVGVEWPFESDRIVCYFSADGRVDFRQLVRDLSREFHERVDMRQIGVREEAAVVGGYAHCGQELCCARLGCRFEPVSIRMAKEQDLPLNSTKISGACGRLMCCLRYEFEAYRDFKSRAPKRNALVDTPIGMAKIVEYDTPKEQVCLRLENGKQIRVALADMVTSDAAKKRAESLGYASRPDTVTREALERLQSPEVRLALAEVDRSFADVTDGRVSDAAQNATKEGTGTRRRRRRRGTQGQADVPSAPSVGSAVEGDGQPARARKRRSRKAGPGQQPAGVPSDATANAVGEDRKPVRTRRRRHGHGTENANVDAPTSRHDPQRGERPSRKTGSQDGQQQRPRRRPGDRGGGQDGVARPSERATDASEPSQPKRRRRHRGGRGRGKGDGAGASATSS